MCVPMKKTQYVLTITLNPAIDKTIVIPHFKRGQIYRPENIALSAGGKGINVSRVLSQLGLNTFASGFLPRKGADFIEPELVQHNIRHHFIKIKGDVRINLTILNPNSQRATRIFEPGGIVRRVDIRKFKDTYKRLLKNASVVIISGSNALGLPHELNGQLISIAKKAGIMTVLDTSLEPLILGIKKKPFMIKPNRQEAEGILNVPLNNKNQIIQALRALHAKGVSIVALTDGEKGSYVYDGNQMVHAIPPKLEQKNPVGCGDAYVAGFIAMRLRARPFSECVRFASACGFANALSINPGQISVNRVYQAFRRVRMVDL